jgi:uncharacterized membrane protein
VPDAGARYGHAMDGDPDRMPRLHDGMQFYTQRGGFEHHGGHHWLALLLIVLLVAALILIAIAAVRIAFSPRTSASATAPADDALSVLRLRYARGEVAREEFLLAHGDLGGGSPPTEVHPA